MTICAPIVSRSLQATTPVGTTMRQEAMYTTMGMQMRLVSVLPDMQAAHNTHRGGGDSVPSHGAEPGDACGYCNLVMPLPLVVVLLLGLLAASLPAPVFRQRTCTSRALRNLRSLGAQAPPFAL